MRIPSILMLITALTAVAASIAGESPAADAPNSEFEKLKQMAGNWEVSSPEGDSYGKAHLAVTAAGTAVIETTFAGTSREMITVYTQNGKRLSATHYCSVGDHPHLLSAGSDTADRIKFDSVDITRVSQSPAAYMRGLEIFFLSDGRMRHERQFYKDDRPSKFVVLIFTRKS